MIKIDSTISSFHTAIHTATTDTIYIETVPVPITDENTQVQSYTHLQVDRPYTALNSETYITIRQQELRDM